MSGECILTTYKTDDKGYGKCNVLRFGKKITRAHILAWVDANGQLPPVDKPLILHSCDNPPCCNPEHLRAGTNAENMLDRVERRSHGHHRMTHCRRGHEYTDENTALRNGRRHCRACDRLGKQRRATVRAELKTLGYGESP